MIPFAVAFVVSLLLVYPVRKLMMGGGVLDTPNHRSSHVSPIPRGGGLACYGALVAGLAVARSGEMSLTWAVVGVSTLAVVGLMDDLRSLSPTLRLIAQGASGCALGLATGDASFVLIGAVATVVLVNVVNFMDGINGITCLSLAVWGVISWLVGVLEGNQSLVVIASLTCAVALGFLPWNLLNARIFLGDSGSYMFGGLAAAGTVAAAAGVQSYGPPDWQSMTAVLSPLIIYGIDTGSVIARRAVLRRPLLEAHREHIYQVLAGELRLGHAKVAVGVAFTSLAVSALWLTYPSPSTLIPIAGVCAIYLGSPWFAGRLSRGMKNHHAPETVGVDDLNKGGRADV